MSDDSAGLDLLVALGIDATKWAEAFMRLASEAEYQTVIGWFANAIMAGYDEGMRRARADNDQLRAELDALQQRGL